MGLTRTLKQQSISTGRFLSIDSSSKSLAFAIFVKDAKSSKLICAGKILFPSDMGSRLNVINATVKALFDSYGPIDHVVIEQTIYIQSPQTSRILSYVVGHIWGKCLEYCDDVRDVEVMKWKSYIGYKNVSKVEKAAWASFHGETEAKKIAAKERKERTGKIIKEKIAGIDEVSDYDMIDAIAIGLWAVANV
jgi:Holliday junction resolvasome RuvABC endonuclease subunit